MGAEYDRFISGKAQAAATACPWCSRPLETLTRREQLDRAFDWFATFLWSLSDPDRFPPSPSWGRFPGVAAAAVEQAERCHREAMAAFDAAAGP